MNSSDRMFSLVWAMVLMAGVVVIFLITSCVSNDSKLDSEYKTNCLSRGGHIEYVIPSDKQSGRTCKIN